MSDVEPVAAEPVTIASAPPMPGAAPDDPAINYAERMEKAIEAQAEEMIPAAISTPGPLVPMTDADAMALAREIEARYMPPPPPPSILTQLRAMKEGGGTQPSYPPAPPPQPDPATPGQ